MWWGLGSVGEELGSGYVGGVAVASPVVMSPIVSA